ATTARSECFVTLEPISPWDADGRTSPPCSPLLPGPLASARRARRASASLKRRMWPASAAVRAPGSMPRERISSPNLLSSVMLPTRSPLALHGLNALSVGVEDPFSIRRFGTALRIAVKHLLFYLSNVLHQQVGNVLRRIVANPNGLVSHRLSPI